MNSKRCKGLPVNPNTILGFTYAIALKVKVIMPLIFQIK